MPRLAWTVILTVCFPHSWDDRHIPPSYFFFLLVEKMGSHYLPPLPNVEQQSALISVSGVVSTVDVNHCASFFLFFIIMKMDAKFCQIFFLSIELTMVFLF
jgi:hypothetical protein